MSHASIVRAQTTVPDECQLIGHILDLTDPKKRLDSVKDARDPEATLSLVKGCANSTTPSEGKNRATSLLAAVQSSPPAENTDYKGNLSAGFGALLLPDADISATVSDGVVRVSNKERTKLGLWLNGVGWASQSKNWNIGLFTGVQLSSDNLQLNSLAAGFAFSPTKQGKNFPSSGSVLLHLGVAATRVKALRDGVSDGDAMPAGVTEAPLVNKTRWGLVVITSYTLN